MVGDREFDVVCVYPTNLYLYIDQWCIHKHDKQ